MRSKQNLLSMLSVMRLTQVFNRNVSVEMIFPAVCNTKPFSYQGENSQNFLKRLRTKNKFLKQIFLRVGVNYSKIIKYLFPMNSNSVRSS